MNVNNNNIYNNNLYIVAVIDLADVELIMRYVELYSQYGDRISYVGFIINIQPDNNITIQYWGNSLIMECM